MIKQVFHDKETTFQPGMVDISNARFAECVDKDPFPLKHQLQFHPLFQIENLVDLAKRLPPEQREYVFAKQEYGSHDDLEEYLHAAENDEFSTAELIDAIEQQNIVIVLRNVESDPLYGRFVNDCLDHLSEQVEPVTGKISGRESFLFVSPPDAYTPYHWDPEQNFFMQVRGRKQMAIYDVNDREILPDSALEKFYNEGQLITNCRADLFENYTLFDMSPGDGVYVPVTAPHWVKTLDEISVSISINFRTPSSIRRDRVYRFNRKMRGLGLNPAPVSPQANRLVERFKSALFAIPSGFKRIFNR